MTGMRQFGGPMAYGKRQDLLKAPGAPAPAAPAPAAPRPGGGAYYDAPGRSAGSYNANAAGSAGAAPGWATDTIRNRYTDALNRTGGQAELGEDAFLDRATEFDASSYMREAATGAWNEFLPQLDRRIEGLRGEQVGMGRLNTGFATEDEDRLVSEGLGRLTNQLSEQALGAAGLNLDNQRQIGGYASEQGGRYLDLIAGQYDRKTAETNAKKRKFWDDVGGAAQVASSAATFI